MEPPPRSGGLPPLTPLAMAFRRMPVEGALAPQRGGEPAAPEPQGEGVTMTAVLHILLMRTKIHNEVLAAIRRLAAV